MFRPRVALYLALCVALAVGVGAYVRYAGVGNRSSAATGTVQETLAGDGSLIYFRHNGAESHYGKLARIRLRSGAVPEFFDEFNCEVVHVAGQRGLCLAAERGIATSYTARIFDTSTLRVLHELPLAGIPSRCRVAADGRRAAFTVFVSGHGYDSVEFSTETLLVDLATGSVEADLETFAVTRDGAPFKELDFNFWGVTFEPDSRYFYATLSSDRKHYLVRGDAETRTAQVVREGVECPSLSPDARHIAFKKRVAVPGPVAWQVAVYDLDDGHETLLAEHNSVDDQLEWLDGGRVLYSRPSEPGGASATTDVWVLPSDGSGEAERLLPGAYSPAVLHRANK